MARAQLEITRAQIPDAATDELHRHALAPQVDVGVVLVVGHELSDVRDEGGTLRVRLGGSGAEERVRAPVEHPPVVDAVGFGELLRRDVLDRRDHVAMVARGCDSGKGGGVRGVRLRHPSRVGGAE